MKVESAASVGGLTLAVTSMQHAEMLQRRLKGRYNVMPQSHSEVKPGGDS